MKKIALLLSLVLVTAPAIALKLPGVSLPLGNAATPAPQTPQQAPATGSVRSVSNPIAGRYIVVLKEGSSSRLATQLLGPLGLKPDLIFESVLRGFAVNMSPAQAARVAGMSQVKYVEQDAWVKGVDVPWGLDRIDQAGLPLDGKYNGADQGADVHAYIIDTGIRSTHQAFKGRLGDGYNSAGASGGLMSILYPVPILGDLLGGGNNGDTGNTEDCNGHGTHVAGSVGGTEYGVAQKVTLHAVRVLNCEGSGAISGVVEGVDWVAKNHKKPAVANMSLGGGASDALDEAVRNAIAQGITFVVAAGNEDTDACGSSPARVPAAITVGSSTNKDARSSFSNKGKCVDLFAPGSDILSAWHTGDSATNTISGTSMASPHVAGAVAAYLAQHPEAKPEEVAAAMTKTAVSDKVTDPAGSPNRLLQVSKGKSPVAAPPVATPPAEKTPATGPDGTPAPGATPAPSAAPQPTPSAPVAATQPASVYASCNALSCVFQSTHAVDDASYAWDFGDGVTSTEKSPQHYYSEFKGFDVTLKVNSASKPAQGGFRLELGKKSTKPCEACFAVQGHLNASDTIQVSPDDYSTTEERDFYAWLKLKDGGQAVLYLDRKDKDQWKVATSSFGNSEDQVLSFSDARAGAYRFRIVSGQTGGRFEAWAGDR